MKKTKQIEQNAKLVNKYLNSKLKGNPKKLYDAAGHLIIHGGKRLKGKLMKLNGFLQKNYYLKLKQIPKFIVHGCLSH